MRTCYNSTEQWLKGPYARIGRICGVKSQVGIAAFLGIKQSSISVAKKRQTIPLEWLLTLWEKVGANPVWILTGRGKKFLVPSDVPEPPKAGASHPAWAGGSGSDPSRGCPLAACLEALTQVAATCPRVGSVPGCEALEGCPVPSCPVPSDLLPPDPGSPDSAAGERAAWEGASPEPVPSGPGPSGLDDVRGADEKCGAAAQKTE